MGSPIEELQRREAAARQEVNELRGEIARLNERLTRAEEKLSRLEITRETAMPWALGRVSRQGLADSGYAG